MQGSTRTFRSHQTSTCCWSRSRRTAKATRRRHASPASLLRGSVLVQECSAAVISASVFSRAVTRTCGTGGGVLVATCRGRAATLWAHNETPPLGAAGSTSVTREQAGEAQFGLV